ncbi:MAG: hypothetical protein ACI9BD_000940 [Candidatus Marinamargulisbacteria bacterium]|jgi:hypothetical protein
MNKDEQFAMQWLSAGLTDLHISFVVAAYPETGVSWYYPNFFVISAMEKILKAVLLYEAGSEDRPPLNLDKLAKSYEHKFPKMLKKLREISGEDAELDSIEAREICAEPVRDGRWAIKKAGLWSQEARYPNLSPSFKTAELTAEAYSEILYGKTTRDLFYDVIRVCIKTMHARHNEAYTTLVSDIDKIEAGTYAPEWAEKMPSKFVIHFRETFFVTETV